MAVYFSVGSARERTIVDLLARVRIHAAIIGRAVVRPATLGRTPACPIAAAVKGMKPAATAAATFASTDSMWSSDFPSPISGPTESRPWLFDTVRIPSRGGCSCQLQIRTYKRRPNLAAAISSYGRLHSEIGVMAACRQKLFCRAPARNFLRFYHD